MRSTVVDKEAPMRKATEKHLDLAVILAALISEDHEEIHDLDILDYLAIMGARLVEDGDAFVASEAYYARLAEAADHDDEMAKKIMAASKEFANGAKD
jgi:hypothetical protein